MNDTNLLSHLLRGPLARIQGLIELSIIDSQADSKALLSHIKKEANDIDSALKKISLELNEF